jgi:hypothetical protein
VSQVIAKDDRFVITVPKDVYLSNALGRPLARHGQRLLDKPMDRDRLQTENIQGVLRLPDLVGLPFPATMKHGRPLDIRFVRLLDIRALPVRQR